MIIQQKILPLMKQVDVHIQRKERLKTITLIEDISELLKTIKKEQLQHPYFRFPQLRGRNGNRRNRPCNHR